MPTTSTTISTSRDGDLSRNSTAGMDVRQRNQILATLRNTGMFFKKLSFGRRRAMPQMNDDMNASMFTRTDHTVQLGQKAFNMSQPTLGMHISPSVILDNEDHSDVSHTGSSSPSPSSQINQRRAEFVAKTYQNGMQHPQVLIPGVQVNSHRPLPNSLPPILEPTPKAVAGLTSSTDPPTSSFLTEAAARAAARDSPSKPYLQVSHSVQSVPATVSDSASTDAPCCVNGDCEQCRQTAEAQSNIQAPSELTTEPPAIIPDTSGQATPQPLLLQSPQIRLTQSLPSRRIQAPSLTSSASQSPSVNSSSGQATPQSTSGEPTPRALHPRLASLPPPMMARFTTQGSARLTPSIVPRPPPMPLLNLPTLPPPTPPSTSVSQSSHTRLRSMPALPHCGPSDLDVRSNDHDSAGIDEMEDLDEEDEDSENVNDEASEDEPSPSSLDIEAPPDMTPRLRVPLPPSISRSRPGSQRLPSIDTSPFALEFGEGSSTAQQTARSSPNVGNRGTVYLTPVEPVAGPSILNTQTPKPPTIERTPASPTDYFNVRTHEVQSQSTDQGGSGAQKDPSRTPRPVDFNDFVPQTVPMPSSSPRPMLTHHTSKSMSDLLTMNGWKDKPKPKENGTATTRVVDAPDYGLATTRDTPPDDAGPSTTPAKRETPPTVRRQRSLPMFTNATDPPPYPDFSPFKHAPPVVPREEEGKERLPPYTNQIYLAAIMPRKMEFDAPGVQSRDRKWKRALCVLEGTAFKVYKVHASVVGDWWERTVGVGDKTSVDPGSVGNAGAIRVSAIRESARQGRAGEAGDGSPKIDPTGPVREERNNGEPSTVHAANTTSIPPSRSKLSLAASLLNPKRHRDRSVDRLGGSSQSSSSRLSIDIPQEENHRSSNGISTIRRSLDSGRSPSRMASTSELSSSRSTNGNRRVSSFATTSASSDSSPSSPLPPATSHFSHLSHHSDVLEQEPDRKDLLRQYSMQHAESGLASDYLKRKNVIRVRMEGEQFLLQARDVPAVIDWIEGIQAATNIALDLDERPMPKGPMFPRRRRRRPRRPADNANPSGANANDASASSASSSARPS